MVPYSSADLNDCIVFQYIYSTGLVPPLLALVSQHSKLYTLVNAPLMNKIFLSVEKITLTCPVTWVMHFQA